MIAIIIIILLTIAFVTAVYQKSQLADCKSRKRLDGRTVLVTGGTSGMGLEMAKDFANRGARVIIACPFENEGTLARNHIVNVSGNENVVFKLLDLGSLASTRKFAVDVLKTEERLDILINNAGVGNSDNFFTEDGINFIMQVNYYGAFCLTILLLPLLRKTGTKEDTARVINTSSGLHICGSAAVQDYNNSDRLNSLFSYSNSKLAMLYFTQELAKSLKGSNVVVNAIAPGLVGTNIFLNAVYSPSIGRFISWISYWLFRTPWQGAQTALHAALDDEAGKVSGEFFMTCKIGRAWPVAYNEKAAQVLWEDSMKLVKMSEEEYDAAFRV